MHLIFDFDGTLVNSFTNVIEKFNLLADEFGFRRVSEDETDSLRDLNSKELIGFLQIPFYKLPKVLLKARECIHEDKVNLAPFDNIPLVLEQLHQQGYKLGILTSNSVEHVTEWLANLDLLGLFSFIHSESNFFGKQRVLKKIIKKLKLNKANTFYVGDETRDIEAAHQAGIRSIAVSWGFNSAAILEDFSPTMMVHEPGDLLKIFTGAAVDEVSLLGVADRASNRY